MFQFSTHINCCEHSFITGIYNNYYYCHKSITFSIIIQILYESAFAMSDIASNFHIHGIHPRRAIPVDVPLSTLQLETPTVVVVEYSDDSPDLFEMFSSVKI